MLPVLHMSAMLLSWRQFRFSISGFHKPGHPKPYATAVQITGLEDRDIVFMRFQGEGGPHCLPYFICLDHEKQAVVVSIRGTLSLEDAVTGAAAVWDRKRFRETIPNPKMGAL